MKVFLTADVLDEQIQDSKCEKAGRIDGIVLTIDGDGPPKLAYVEVSPITLLSRLNHRLAEWYARFDRRFGPERGKPFRLPWSRLTREGVSYRMDLDVNATPINDLETWLRDHVVERIPGA